MEKHARSADSTAHSIWDILFLTIVGIFILILLTFLMEVVVIPCFQTCTWQWPRRRAYTTETELRDIEQTSAERWRISPAPIERAPDLCWPAASHQSDGDSQRTLWDGKDVGGLVGRGC